eukprot:2837601-Amphidinium_carterae.1
MKSVVHGLQVLFNCMLNQVAQFSVQASQNDKHTRNSYCKGIAKQSPVELLRRSRYVPDRPVKPGEIREAKEDNLYRYPPVDDCGYGSGPEVEALSTDRDQRDQIKM